MPTSSKSLITIIVLITIGAFVCGGFVYLDGRGREAGGGEERETVNEQTTIKKTTTDKENVANDIVATTDTGTDADTADMKTTTDEADAGANDPNSNVIYFVADKGSFLVGDQLYTTGYRAGEEPIDQQFIGNNQLNKVATMPENFTFYSLAKAPRSERWFYSLIDWGRVYTGNGVTPLIYRYDSTTDKLANIASMLEEENKQHTTQIRSVSDNGRYVALDIYSCDDCGRWPADIILIDVVTGKNLRLPPSTDFSWLANDGYQYIPYQIIEPCEDMGSRCYVEQDNEKKVVSNFK